MANFFRTPDKVAIMRRILLPKYAGRSLYQGLKKYYRRLIYLQRLSYDVNLKQSNFIAGHVSVYSYKCA